MKVEETKEFKVLRVKLASCPLKDAGYPSAICQTAASFFISPHRPIKTTSGTGNELESTDSYPPSATNESTKFVSAGSGSGICTRPPADSHCVCLEDKRPENTKTHYFISKPDALCRKSANNNPAGNFLY